MSSLALAPGPARTAHGLDATVACFHCGERLGDSTLTAAIQGRHEPVCCTGCQAVAELICGAGLADFYRHRDVASARPDTASGASDVWAAYAQLELAQQFTRPAKGGSSVTLMIEGLRCAACSWLIDKMVRQLPEIADVSVNAATGRALIEWRGPPTRLAEVLRTIARLGYKPHPLNDTTLAEAQQAERRSALKRLAVAAFGMMQVMMFAVAVYSAELSGEIMEADMLRYFRIVSLLVATPVMFYAGAPFLISAWNSLKARSVGMDVPVSIALLLAYVASVWNTLSAGNDAHVYFDSVTMFIFFLTLGRFVQMTIRQRTSYVSDALARQLPAFAHRVDAAGDLATVPLAALRADDVALVKVGEVVPADGELLDENASLDESMLTGESVPVHKHAGAAVTGGTLNVEGPIRIKVRHTGAGTVLSHMLALLQRGQALKPAMMRSADAAAAKFLVLVLIGAGATCAAWLAIDPARAFSATLAVLVVACPCAFAIATPSALAAAVAYLARHGVLVTNPDALETLARVDHVLFDKTGTLTRGEVRVARCLPSSDLSQADCLHIAAALEATSEHPLARAFRAYDGARRATDIDVAAGRGVEGTVDGKRYRVGSAAYVAELRGEPPLHQQDGLGGTLVALGDEQAELALIELSDASRANAPQVIAHLREHGIEAEILSGDNRSAVERVAQECGITHYRARHSAAQKLERVTSLQRDLRRVAMVGDGVNDAPVLGAADVSIAMGRGAALAHASAGMVLVGEDLASLPHAIAHARRMMRIARQNLIWSAVYNLGSLPLAALGYIPPWLAALGMSLSSVAVMLNAMRLMPSKTPASAGPIA